MNRMPYTLMLLILLIFAVPVISSADIPGPDDSGRGFALHVENDDLAGGGDDQYTSGVKLTWSRFGMAAFPEDAWLHKWLYPVVNFLGIRPDGKKEFALTTAVGQNIFTPEDIESEEVIEDDRPYAGMTYVELGYHQKNGRHMDTLEFFGGIVGPHSYAEEIQSGFHEAVNGTEPNGWDNQLEDEPVLGIIYEYKQKMAARNIGSGFGRDFIFNTGGAIGNAQTYYNIGGTFRWGWNVPDDFGTFPIRPVSTFGASSKSAFGLHLFLSADGRAVIRNIFLDGNTFKDSHSVDKKPIVGAITGGIGLTYGQIKTSFAYVYQTRTFDEEDDPQAYGSLNFSVVY